MTKEYRGPFDRNSLLHIQWHLGNYCNYRCSYCNDGLRDGSRPFIDIEPAKRFVKSVTAQAKARGQRVEFTLSGGEPTVYKDLPELLEYMHEHHAYAHIITNASRSVNYYRRIVPLLSHGALLTFHSDHAQLDKFLEVCELFHPGLLQVYVPMNPAKWDLCVEAFHAVMGRGYRAIAKTVFEGFGQGGTNKVVFYTPEQRRFLQAAQNIKVPQRTAPAQWIAPKTMLILRTPPKTSTPHRFIEIVEEGKVIGLTEPQSLILTKQNDFRGMKCNAGLEFLLVGFDGYVLKANCRPSNEILADLRVNPEFTLPSDPITCDVASCWCEGDLMVNKYPG